MASLASLLHAASCSVQQRLAQASQGWVGVVGLEERDSEWGFQDSSNELLNGLEVTEVPPTQALAGLLPEASRRSL